MATQQTSSPPRYYVPEQSKWPIIGSIGLFLTLGAAGSLMVRSGAGNDTTLSWVVFLCGALVLAYMLFGWLGYVIRESQAGLYSKLIRRCFRWGMPWFILR